MKKGKRIVPLVENKYSLIQSTREGNNECPSMILNNPSSCFIFGQRKISFGTILLVNRIFETIYIVKNFLLYPKHRCMHTLLNRKPFLLRIWSKSCCKSDIPVRREVRNFLENMQKWTFFLSIFLFALLLHIRNSRILIKTFEIL